MFEGNMHEGIKCGFGRLYWDNGKVVYSGYWKKNIPVGNEIIIHNKAGEIIYKGKSLGIYFCLFIFSNKFRYSN